MLVGQFEHAIDAKGRVVLPAAFRKALASGGYVTRGLDCCLSVWTPEEFEREAADMQDKARRGEIDRAAVRSLAAGAAEITPDGQGRVAIPQHLREYAGLNRDVTIVGAFSSVEIWDAARWREVNQTGEAVLAGNDA